MLGLCYVFDHWSGYPDSASSLRLVVDGPLTVTAIWTRDYSVLYGNLIRLALSLGAGFVAVWFLRKRLSREQEHVAVEEYYRSGRVPPSRRRTKLNDVLGYSLRAMRERKLRAIMTIAMVMTGAGLMVALSGLTTGVYQYMGGQFGTLGANVVIVWAYEQSPTDKVASAIGGLPGVRTTIPFVMRTVTLDSGGTSDSILLTGEDHAHLKEVYPNLRLSEGTLLDSNDTVGIVLGHSLAYPSDSEAPVTRVGSNVTLSSTVFGEELQIVSRNFVVRGILGEMGGAVEYISADRMAFISLPAAMSFFQIPEGEYDGLNVITTAADTTEKVAETIRQDGESFEIDTLHHASQGGRHVSSEFESRPSRHDGPRYELSMRQTINQAN